MVLEANARPGLAIQISNGRGLLDSPEPDRGAGAKRDSLGTVGSGGLYNNRRRTKVSGYP